MLQQGAKMIIENPLITIPESIPLHFDFSQLNLEKEISTLIK